MPEWLVAILDWLRANPHLAGVAIGLVAFLEGLAVVGILMPGIVILFGFGALVGLGVLDLATVWIWCSAGAIVGDGLSFWLGHHFKDSVRDIWPITRYPGLLEQGESFFRRHGLKSVIIGRFVGPIRPIIPLVAGMLQMPVRIYLPANILAGIVWAPAYLLPGLVFGASLELAQAVAWRLALLLVLIGGAIWLLAIGIKAVYLMTAPFANKLTAAALKWSRNHPLLGGIARNLVDPKRPESASLLALGLFLLLASGAAMWLLVTMPMEGRETFDMQVGTAIATLRSPWTDQWMVLFASLGSLWVVIPACAALLLWLGIRRQHLAAIHLAVAGGFGALLAVAMSLVVSKLSGNGLAPVSQITLAVAGYGFVAILLAVQLPARSRLWPYVVSALLIVLAASGRVYLGVHGISQVLLGLCLGAVWVIAVGIAYRRRARRLFLVTPAAGIFFVALIVALAVDVRRHGQHVLAAAFPPAAPVQVTLGQWSAPQVIAPPDENVTFLVAGSPATILDRLDQAGWQEPPPANWQTPIAMLQPDPAPQTLPLLPATVGNYRELATRVKMVREGEIVAVRLWPTALQRVSAQGTVLPVWAGRSARYQIRQVLYFFHFWQRKELLGLPAILAPLDGSQVLRALPMESLSRQ
ncbi:MAG: VTT domain-containing protein [Lysobacterales bacterium]